VALNVTPPPTAEVIVIPVPAMALNMFWVGLFDPLVCKVIVVPLPHVPDHTGIRLELSVRQFPLAPVLAGNLVTAFDPAPTSKSPADHPTGIAHVSVPLLLTGDPLTANPLGALNPTLFTVPVPGNGG
jgi:hypothetical protein